MDALGHMMQMACARREATLAARSAAARDHNLRVARAVARLADRCAHRRARIGWKTRAKQSIADWRRASALRMRANMSSPDFRIELAHVRRERERLRRRSATMERHADRQARASLNRETLLAERVDRIKNNRWVVVQLHCRTAAHRRDAIARRLEAATARRDGMLAQRVAECEYQGGYRELVLVEVRNRRSEVEASRDGQRRHEAARARRAAQLEARVERAAAMGRPRHPRAGRPAPYVERYDHRDAAVAMLRALEGPAGVGQATLRRVFNAMRVPSKAELHEELLTKCLTAKRVSDFKTVPTPAPAPAPAPAPMSCTIQ